LEEAAAEDLEVVVAEAVVDVVVEEEADVALVVDEEGVEEEVMIKDPQIRLFL